MAKPIKETPILYGKDAERFSKKIKENKKKKISDAEYKKAVNNYNKIKNYAEF